MPRNRDRQSAQGLLPRMEARQWKSGKTVTYRYHPVGGKPMNLGTDKIAAIRKVLDLNGRSDAHGTLRWVWEQYQTAPRWLKLAQVSRADYISAWKQIDLVLGHLQISMIDSPTVARYVHVERAKSPRRADIEKSLLSRLFGHGIKLGVCTVNATIGVEPHGSEPRTEAPKAEVLAKFLEWLQRQTPQRQIIGMMAEYASLAGNRRVEFLDLSWPQIDEEAKVVRTKRAKQRGKKRGEVIELVTITPALQALIDRLKMVRAQRGVDCLYVFPSRGNNAYNDRGFKTLWQRCVLQAIDEKVMTAEDRFTFHDLRAHYTTVHKAATGQLPDLHANPATTARVYDRTKVVTRKALG
jgi:integrase